MARNIVKEALIFYSVTLAFSLIGIAAIISAMALNGPLWAHAAGYILVAAAVVMTVIARFRYATSKLTGYDRINGRNDYLFKSLRNLLKR